ncbi:MAG: hypothetical protein R2794_06885 [Chitinophagales bacterium]
MNRKELTKHLRSLLDGGALRNQMLEAYHGLEEKLGGGASDNAASFIVKMLS